MLPASLQAPAASVLLVVGLLSCFAGYRLFRTVLALYGFVLGALIASSLMGADQATSMIVAALLGGVAGALILIFAYFVGVALAGAAVGAFAANVIWSALGREPGLWALVALCAAGALLALALQRHVIVLSTAFGGAWTTLVGGVAVAGDRLGGRLAVRNEIWLPYPLDPAPGQRWVAVAWVALGVVGAVVQLGLTGRRRRA